MLVDGGGTRAQRHPAVAKGPVLVPVTGVSPNPRSGVDEACVCQLFNRPAIRPQLHRSALAGCAGAAIPLEVPTEARRHEESFEIRSVHVDDARGLHAIELRFEVEAADCSFVESGFVTSCAPTVMTGLALPQDVVESGYRARDGPKLP